MMTNKRIKTILNVSIAFLILFPISLFTTSLSTVQANITSSDFGDGTDGEVTLSSSKNINTESLGSSSDDNGNYADGIAYRVSSISGSTITTTSNTTGFSNGDKILIINLQGTNTDFSDTGNYEILDITSVSGTSVNINSSPANEYDGTGDSYVNQKVIVQRIPQYSSVTLNSGGTITAASWDGLTTTPTGNAGFYTGIVAIFINSDLQINSGGSINVNELGYRGGVKPGLGYGGDGGEAYCGIGGIGGTSHWDLGHPTTGNPGGDGASGGGGARYRSGGDGFCGGGGGGDIVHGASGGTGSVSTGGAGGGGGYTRSGGGGGGHRTIGYGGFNNPNHSGVKGQDGGTESSGNASQGGGGGGTYGVGILDNIYFGSGGGSGGPYSPPYGTGGSGGGIVFISARNIEVNSGGIIEINGGDGETAPAGNNSGGGGGGAGGSLFINTYNLSNSGSLEVNGGMGGEDGLTAGDPCDGGDGGDGRGAIYYVSVLSGTIDPAFYTENTGNLILNLDSNNDPITNSDWQIDVSINGQLGVVGVGVKNSKFRIATLDVDFSEDRDWSQLVADSSDNKSLFHYPGGFSSIPGATGSGYTLYVPKRDSDEGVGICSNATLMNHVGDTCDGLYYLTEDDNNVEVVTEDGVTYWKVSGLTGSGGFSATNLPVTGNFILNFEILGALLVLVGFSLNIKRKYKFKTT
jgi:hypothetical protein